MKNKKVYTKPRVEEIQLVVQSPILALCNSVSPGIEAFPSTCNFPTAICSDA